MKKTLLAALGAGVLLFALGVSGCSSGATGLEGKTWVLESYGDPGDPAAVIAGSEVTAEFLEGEVAGTAGCNRYFGSYTADCENLSFGPLASTEMWCVDPEGVMDQEQAYLRTLGKAKEYEVRDGMLRVTCTDGQVLTFAEE